MACDVDEDFTKIARLVFRFLNVVHFRTKRSFDLVDLIGEKLVWRTKFNSIWTVQ